jgi:Mn2+/Fe2+ NRAMP family transporter
MSDNAPDASAKHHVSMVQTPPTSFFGILSRLGPGLIIAGSIVGSGELIATTSTGGKAGFTLLWLIIIGCVIKVFVQIEFGRFSIVTGKTTMEGLNDIPGPRSSRLGNWLLWYWFFMFFSSLGQLGGIVGGVGQALAISAPITQAGREYNAYREAVTQLEVATKELQLRRTQSNVSAKTITELETRVAKWQTARQKFTQEAPPSRDDKLWACLLTVVTAILLVLGRYRLLETASTILVAGFTLVTIVNVVLLQMHPTWHMTWNDLWHGLSFQLPKSSDGNNRDAIFFALATFGIIGVGTNELLAYPYFCVEKGYARFTGPRDRTENWASRARGWMRVMRVDAWCSMVVYTFATVAFFILGASILHPIGLEAKGPEMIRTLAIMYEPIFGSMAPGLFLIGAFAVLYSTFFVANAGHARVCADVVRVVSNGAIKQEGFVTWVKRFSGLLPFVCLFMYLVFPEPRRLIFISGILQNLMLPMLAGAALYFRYRRGDERVRPSFMWDVFLWISAAGLLIVALWAGWDGIRNLLEFVQKLFK